MPRKRSKGRIAAVRAHGEMSLGTLGDNTTVSANMFADAVEGSDIYLVSGDLNIGIQGSTSGELPILFGVAHDDYTDLEITECLQADQLDFSDKIQMEKARRTVREWGQLAETESASGHISAGNMVRYKFRFRSEQGHNVKIWAHNFSGGTLTTGATLYWSGKVYVKKL